MNPRSVLLIAWLTLMWVALWGDPAPGTVLGGLLVATAIALAVPPRHPEHGVQIHPWAALRFVVFVAWSLVVSTWDVVLVVLAPRGRLRAGIVAVPLRGVSDGVTTVVANSITLTPGTFTVEVVTEPSTIVYVHALSLGELDDLRADVLHLEAVAIRAFGSDADIAALRAELTGAPPAATDDREEAS